MNYALEWTDRAVNQLAAVWLTAADQLAVTQAAHRLTVVCELIQILLVIGKFHARS